MHEKGSGPLVTIKRQSPTRQMAFLQHYDSVGPVTGSAWIQRRLDRNQICNLARCRVVIRRARIGSLALYQSCLQLLKCPHLRFAPLQPHKPTRMPLPKYIYASNGSALLFNSRNKTTTRTSGSYNRVRYRSNLSYAGESYDIKGFDCVRSSVTQIICDHGWTRSRRKRFALFLAVTALRTISSSRVFQLGISPC